MTDTIDFTTESFCKLDDNIDGNKTATHIARVITTHCSSFEK